MHDLDLLAVAKGFGFEVRATVVVVGGGGHTDGSPSHAPAAPAQAPPRVHLNLKASGSSTKRQGGVVATGSKAKKQGQRKGPYSGKEDGFSGRSDGRQFAR